MSITIVSPTPRELLSSPALLGVSSTTFRTSSEESGFYWSTILIFSITTFYFSETAVPNFLIAGAQIFQFYAGGAQIY